MMDVVVVDWLLDCMMGWGNARLLRRRTGLGSLYIRTSACRWGILLGVYKASCPRRSL